MLGGSVSRAKPRFVLSPRSLKRNLHADPNSRIAIVDQPGIAIFAWFYVATHSRFYRESIREEQRGKETVAASNAQLERSEVLQAGAVVVHRGFNRASPDGRPHSHPSTRSSTILGQLQNVVSAFLEEPIPWIRIRLMAQGIPPSVKFRKEPCGIDGFIEPNLLRNDVQPSFHRGVLPWLADLSFVVPQLACRLCLRPSVSYIRNHLAGSQLLGRVTCAEKESTLLTFAYIDGRRTGFNADRTDVLTIESVK